MESDPVGPLGTPRVGKRGREADEAVTVPKEND
jgi:hypothetical protein